ncbi:MAG: ACT domain-containing protein [Candidatus Sulfotelmatobacter sp.]
MPIFAISTYDTDYVLIQEEYWGAAISSLQRAGHELWPRDESWRKFIE